jgi:hypothetical protein
MKHKNLIKTFVFVLLCVTISNFQAIENQPYDTMFRNPIPIQPPQLNKAGAQPLFPHDNRVNQYLRHHVHHLSRTSGFVAPAVIGTAIAGTFFAAPASASFFVFGSHGPGAFAGLALLYLAWRRVHDAITGERYRSKPVSSWQEWFSKKYNYWKKPAQPQKKVEEPAVIPTTE